MTPKTPYEVPAEMREFAERSVEQARKAFDGFIGAATKAVDTAQVSAESARLNTHDVARKAIGYAENNVSAAFELAQKLVKSKDLTEVMAHQSEFMKAQMEALQSQFKEMGAAAQDVATKAAETITKAAKPK
ncbi:phasin [Bosea sp. (in: a-proteobacteria)]|jgi:phasin|uniref:phasin n=1 Tax=Bosea sp. (in: a-proteobacteria) TaxID=1871050 RepID=UPI002734A6BC|nr:phasin [Bosea sp. (in: a-proteobacteria)]MDP3408990.1 phasin [Bosea sp. (in: a-proteobacteria)]